MSGPVVRLWLPVLAWAALIFAFSSVPDLGTGLGGWDLVLRKLAHAAEFAVLGALLARAAGSTRLAAVLGLAYAVSDELHQTFVPGRMGSAVDVAIDAAGVLCGVVLWQLVRARNRVSARPLAVDLDGALGDTRPLWEAWLSSAAGLLGFDPAALPADRVAAANALDGLGTGNWRALLERFSEDRAAIYLRRNPRANAALRALEAAGHPIGVFTDAPEPLARVALRQLGALHLVSTVAAGEGALERLRLTLGADTLVANETDDLVRYAPTPAS